MTKGYAIKKPKQVHDLVKKGYTKAHIKNSSGKKFKNFDHAVRLHNGVQPGLEEGDNNFSPSPDEEEK